MFQTLHLMFEQQSTIIFALKLCDSSETRKRISQTFKRAFRLPELLLQSFRGIVFPISKRKAS